MPAPPRLYRLLTWGTHALLPAGAQFSPKLRAGLDGRRAERAQLQQWHDQSRDRDRPLLHVHAASAGEWRQAAPVLRRLRTRHPDWQVAVTCSSPSGVPVARSLGADLCAFLPWDRPEEVRAFLAAVDPQVSLVTQLDVWPEFVLAAQAQGVRLGLFAATVRQRSGRLGAIARAVTNDAYAAFELVAAVDGESATRCLSLGARAERVRVCGDPRADAVLERLREMPERRVSHRTEDPLLVAGSTWPADDAVLLEAFALVRRTHPAARLLLAPHEPGEAVLRRITQRAAALHLPEPRAVEQAGSEDHLLLEHRVGGLALLYGMGTMAYVGGGFGGAGLHSVLEPAGWALPVITGPRWQEQAAAARLQTAGGLAPLPVRGAAAALAALWRRWLQHDDARRAAGEAARRALEEDLGAAERIADVLEPLFMR